jgi:hypothetical protein
MNTSKLVDLIDKQSIGFQELSEFFVSIFFLSSLDVKTGSVKFQWIAASLITRVAATENARQVESGSSRRFIMT